MYARVKAISSILKLCKSCNNLIKERKEIYEKIAGVKLEIKRGWKKHYIEKLSKIKIYRVIINYIFEN